MPQHDVLIIGAGHRGQQAALAAAEAGATVAIMSKVHPVRSHSNAAAGGINAALNPRTPGNRTPSTPSRAQTTWATRTRSRSCREAPNEILCRTLRVTFHRSKDGHLGTRAFGGALPGAHVRRGRHHRPGAAARPLRAAQEVPRAHRPLRVVRPSLLQDGEGRCTGAIARNIRDGRMEVFSAKATIQASGVPARRSADDHAATICTGDGIAQGTASARR